MFRFNMTPKVLEGVAVVRINLNYENHQYHEASLRTMFSYLEMGNGYSGTNRIMREITEQLNSSNDAVDVNELFSNVEPNTVGIKDTGQDFLGLGIETVNHKKERLIKQLEAIPHIDSVWAHITWPHKLDENGLPTDDVDYPLYRSYCDQIISGLVFCVAQPDSDVTMTNWVEHLLSYSNVTLYGYEIDPETGFLLGYDYQPDDPAFAVIHKDEGKEPGYEDLDEFATATQTTPTSFDEILFNIGLEKEDAEEGYLPPF